jgi:tRNA pseudouridine32 synthase / 23S rRNA pseudouridine746 synthase
MISVLFEDDDIAAVYKPEGVVSIPGRGPAEPTMIDLVSEHFSQKMFVVHRLDKEVSGVMLFAKNAAAHKNINAQFFNRSIRKSYLLLALGRFDKDYYSVNKSIREFGSGRMGVDELRGKPSVTDFSAVDRNDRVTLALAFPKTGRRHQIRVHSYGIGHPIAGDMHYGDKTQQQGYARLMLHALSISFGCSSGNKTIVCPPPVSFISALDATGLSWSGSADRIVLRASESDEVKTD